MEVNERRLHSSPRERLERVRGGERGGERGAMERLGRKWIRGSLGRLVCGVFSSSVFVAAPVGDLRRRSPPRPELLC
ncbi:putative teneurin-3-like [Clarias magur]|uniref:Putative teneurin-3-like n=1 Tax=Clarias magur TaxID=1594786 RepID=A0A8J4XDL5_CLAMG|nr:putative teneurin-3-like [Clarias magur]